MPASLIAGNIAQAMAKGKTPPKEGENQAQETGTPGEGSTTLTPQYKKKNIQDLQGQVKYDPNQDYNAKLKKFFGMVD